MINPVLTALAQARMRDAPVFVRWCELNGLRSCPVAPATVARFVADCASLGIDRLWPVVQQISNMHASLGLADPTLGGAPAVAISEVAGIAPPRSWPECERRRFKSLPYDVQAYIASREAQRERVLRRAQNEAAKAHRKIAALESQTRKDIAHDDKSVERGETGNAD